MLQTFQLQRKSPPTTHWIACWLGPRAGMDMVVRRKIPVLLGIKSVIQPAPSHYTDRVSMVLW